jgi:hypothetical protein
MSSINTNGNAPVKTEVSNYALETRKVIAADANTSSETLLELWESDNSRLATYDKDESLAFIVAGNPNTFRETLKAISAYGDRYARTRADSFLALGVQEDDLQDDWED